MAESVYKIIEVVGTTWEKAAAAGSAYLRNRATRYRARVKLSFKFEE
jgi:flavin-binding protein dodecin